MNSINASTGFSGFQLQMGQMPCLIPPIVPTSVSDPPDKEILVWSIISQLEIDSSEVKDLASKVSQAFHANKEHGAEDTYAVGDKVMLSMLHQHKEYKAANKSHVAKFFSRWDGPFTVTHAFLETSNYTIHQPNAPKVFPTFHSSLLKQHVDNNSDLFPSCEHAWPSLIVISDGIKEYKIERIIDKCKMGQGYQYLVVGLVTPQLMTCGSLDANLKTVLYWMIGWLVRQWEKAGLSSPRPFFGLGSSLGPSTTTTLSASTTSSAAFCFSALFAELYTPPQSPWGILELLEESHHSWRIPGGFPLFLEEFLIVMLYIILTRFLSWVQKLPFCSHVTNHIWNIVMLYIILTSFLSWVQKLPFHSHVTYHIWYIVMLGITSYWDTFFFSQVQKLPFHSHVTYRIWNIVMLYIILTRFLTWVWKWPLCSHVTYQT